MMTDDRCDYSDLPKATCAHCGARPGTRVPTDRPWTFNGITMTRRSVFTNAPEPSTWATGRDIPNLKLRNNDTGCGCGQPTRDHAYACDDCAGELARALGDIPWLVEQLDISITGQKGKRPGIGGHSNGDKLPWNAKASNVLHALHDHLATTVLYCTKTHVPHQSPYHGPPAGDLEAMSRWLLWRVDGLTLNQRFTDVLRDTLAIEKRANAVIDRAPDRTFLGMCQLAQYDLCDGAVYATVGDPIGKCRECGMEYDAEDRRRSLEKALDDRLCTAAEIADLATYLGIEKPRELVRKRINGWHKRGQIKAVTVRTELVIEERFRYGDVAPLLSALYGTKGA